MIEQLAKKLAEMAHSDIDQRRKYTNEPYINHPAAVVDLVRSVPHTKAMICAAWLHDVVEDTPMTLGVVEKFMGREVAELVEMLTDVSRPEDGNRSSRKAVDKAHTAKASNSAKTIKLADLIDNTRSIVKHDPKFAEVYLAEKAALLHVLVGGDETLMAVARKTLAEGLEQLRKEQALDSMARNADELGLEW